MASFNRVILMGNVTRDIELKYTQSQLAVTELGVAVNDKRKNAKGEWVEETTFVDVTLWGRTAEIAGEYLGKGSSVLVEGRLKLDSWEKDGQKRSKLRVVAENMRMLGGKGGGGGRGGSPPPDESEYGESSGSSYGGSSGGGSRGGSRGNQGGGGGSRQPAGEEDIPF